MNDSYSEDPADNYYNISAVSEQGSHSIPYTIHMVSMVIYSITFVLGIPGNALVIWVASMKMKKTVTTIWYVNLAVADLLCCLAIPFFMTDLVLDYHFPYGVAMCKVLSSVINLNMFASVFTLTMISLDRFILVIWPVWAQNHRSIPGAWRLCGLAWFLSLLLSLPELIYCKIVEVNDQTYCEYDKDSSDIRVTFFTSSVFGFLVPLLVMTVCYLLIARRVTIGQFKSQKALRIMVGVVTAFFICWMPYHAYSLVVVYGAYREEISVDVAVVVAVQPLVFSLVCINSCLNPVLYVFMGKDFKKGVRLSLCRGFENAFCEDATQRSSALSSRSMGQMSAAGLPLVYPGPRTDLIS